MSSRPCLVLLPLVLAAGAPHAHVLLDEPTRRYDDMKGPPCGRGDGLDGRTERFSRFAPGETITVRWTETIDHVGTFRVAFDADGADAADFDAQVLHTEADPDNESGRTWEAQIQLPDIACTNCTLQLQQVMTTNPNPSVDQIYFQCADLVLGDGDSADPTVDGGLPGAGCSSTDTNPGTTAVPLLGLLLLLAGRPLPGRRRQSRQERPAIE